MTEKYGVYLESQMDYLELGQQIKNQQTYGKRIHLGSSKDKIES